MSDGVPVRPEMVGVENKFSELNLSQILFGIPVTSTLYSRVFMFNYMVLLGKWYINSHKETINVLQISFICQV